jgi:exodeoxyribonuclease V gamma subunit
MSLGALDSYKLRDEIVRRHLAGERSVERERTRAAMLGDLPSGNLAGLWFDGANAELQSFLDGIGRPEFLEPEIVEVDGASWRITGRVDHITASGRMEVRPANRKPKDLIRAWITHLVLCASRDGMETTVIALDGKTVLPCVDDAVALLDELVVGYRAALRAPLPVFEGASSDYVERLVSTSARTSKSPVQMASDAYKLSESNGVARGDLRDPFVALCWRGRHPLMDAFDDFETHSVVLWRPLLQCMREETLTVSQ